MQIPDHLDRDDPGALDTWMEEQIRARGPLPRPPPRREEPKADAHVYQPMDAFTPPSAPRGPCLKCGRPLDGATICVRCVMRMRERAVEIELAPARESVDPDARWALDMNAVLRERCPAVLVRGERKTNVALEASLVATALLERRLLAVVFTGQSRAGKGALAGRITGCILASGAAAAVYADPAVPEPRAMTMARCLRWIGALDISERALGAGMASEYDRALGASIAVLDDVGAGLEVRSTPHDPRTNHLAAERAVTLGKLLQRRWALNRPSLITTFMNSVQFGLTLGGGVHGRLFGDERAITIEVCNGDR